MRHTLPSAASPSSSRPHICCNYLPIHGKYSSAFIVFVVVCDMVYFGGRLTQMEWVGVGFAAVAVILLELGREKHDEPPPPAAAEFASEDRQQ